MAALSPVAEQGVACIPHKVREKSPGAGASEPQQADGCAYHPGLRSETPSANPERPKRSQEAHGTPPRAEIHVCPGRLLAPFTLVMASPSLSLSGPRRPVCVIKELDWNFLRSL